MSWRQVSNLPHLGNGAASWKLAATSFHHNAEIDRQRPEFWPGADVLDQTVRFGLGTYLETDRQFLGAVPANIDAVRLAAAEGVDQRDRGICFESGIWPRATGVEVVFLAPAGGTGPAAAVSASSVRPATRCPAASVAVSPASAASANPPQQQGGTRLGSRAATQEWWEQSASL